jgi:hypothetical protein
MLITKMSQLSGVNHTLDININQDQLDALATNKKPHIQDVLPDLSADEREFLMTGITAAEWNALFGE